MALADIIRIATNLYLERQKKAKAVVMTPIEISKDREDTLEGIPEEDDGQGCGFGICDRSFPSWWNSRQDRKHHV